MQTRLMRGGDGGESARNDDTLSSDAVNNSVASGKPREFRKRIGPPIHSYIYVYNYILAPSTHTSYTIAYICTHVNLLAKF